MITIWQLSQYTYESIENIHHVDQFIMFNIYQLKLLFTCDADNCLLF